MKNDINWPLLIITPVVFSFFLLFCFVEKQNLAIAPPLEIKNQILGSEIQGNRQGLPMRLIIPAIYINARIQDLGVTPTGEMEVPSNAVDAGWFDLGPRPGEKGSAVIAGHFSRENSKAGVFTDLDKLKKGDKLYIENDKGASIVFVVREKRIYDPGYVDEVFGRNDGTYLNLITCDGVWDEVKKSYSKRLVVFTDITD